jgi:hypothetical protein
MKSGRRAPSSASRRNQFVDSIQREGIAGHPRQPAMRFQLKPDFGDVRQREKFFRSRLGLFRPKPRCARFASCLGQPSGCRGQGRGRTAVSSRSLLMRPSFRADISTSPCAGERAWLLNEYVQEDACAALCAMRSEASLISRGYATARRVKGSPAPRSPQPRTGDPSNSRCPEKFAPSGRGRSARSAALGSSIFWRTVSRCSWGLSMMPPTRLCRWSKCGPFDVNLGSRRSLEPCLTTGTRFSSGVRFKNFQHRVLGSDGRVQACQAQALFER